MNTYIRMLICLTAIAVLAAPSCAVPMSFMVHGLGSYNNGIDCDNLAVGITNPDNGKTWTAETSGNYYQINISSGIDLNATEVLRFDASDGTGSTSVTDYTFTQVEVDAGAFEYNITLELPPLPTVVSIGSAEGSVGDSVNVSINVTDAPDIGAMDIRLVYNASILGATNVVNGSMMESLPAPIIEYHIGYVDINISFVTYPEAIDGDGELFIVTFDVIGGNAGDSSPLNLEAEAYTTDLSPVALVTDDGVVTVIGSAPDTVVSIGSAEGSVGDSVNVSINVTDAPDIGAMDIRLVYNASILGATNVVNGSMMESLPAPIIEYHIGYVDINISFVTYPEAIDGDGELFIVTFDVIGGNAGDSSPLNLEAEAYTTDVSPVALVTDDGVVTVIGSAPDTVVSIGSAEGSVGDSVNVSINVTDAPDIGAMDIRLVYNASILGATNVVNGSMMESLPAPIIEYHIGYVDINISFVTYPEAIDGDGELFIVTFDVIGGNAGDSSPLNLEAEAYTTNLSPVALVTDDGVVTVIESAPDPAPSLVTYTISNTTISPNGDGVMDDTEIDLKFSEPVDAAIRIEDATGVIKTLYIGSDVTDPDPQTWDGTDDSGNIVADGIYQVNVTMDDGVNPAVYDNTGSITMLVDMSVSTISIGSGSGIVTIPIAIEDGVNVGACDITFMFDASVVNVTDVTGGDMDVTMVNLEQAHVGIVRIGAFQTSNPELNGNIIFANVMFEPVGSAGDTCSLNLSVTTFKDATPTGNELPYIVRNGTYLVSLNGDVNGDGMADLHDAMYLAKHVLGMSGFEVIIIEAADVNNDKVIDIVDSMYLAKHVLGKSGFEELR